MTASELKALYCRHCPGGHFFDRKTMKFFGDTMANFAVRDVGRVKSGYGKGAKKVEAVVLYRKRPNRGGLHGDVAHFRKDTGQVIYHAGEI